MCVVPTWTTLSFTFIMLFMKTEVSSMLEFPCIIIVWVRARTTFIGIERSPGPTSGGAGCSTAYSRDRPHMGPVRKNSRHAQQLPLFLGHLPSSRETVLAALAGLSIWTHPTSTAFMMLPIPVYVDERVVVLMYSYTYPL